jgi:hypothetical protein
MKLVVYHPDPATADADKLALLVPASMRSWPKVNEVEQVGCRVRVRGGCGPCPRLAS